MVLYWQQVLDMLLKNVILNFLIQSQLGMPFGLLWPVVIHGNIYKLQWFSFQNQMGIERTPNANVGLLIDAADKAGFYAGMDILVIISSVNALVAGHELLISIDGLHIRSKPMTVLPKEFSRLYSASLTRVFVSSLLKIINLGYLWLKYGVWCWAHTQKLIDLRNKSAFLLLLELHCPDNIVPTFVYFNSVVCIEDVPCLDLRVLLMAKRCTVILGCIDSYSTTVESLVKLRHRISEYLLYISADRLQLSPTCGLAFLPEGMSKWVGIYFRWDYLDLDSLRIISFMKNHNSSFVKYLRYSDGQE